MTPTPPRPGASSTHRSADEDRPSGASEDKRLRILTAARKLLAERRYDEASMAQIAARARVAKGTLYLYFPSKAALAEALTIQVRDAVDAAAAQAFRDGATLTERLTSLARHGV
ncbi:MAG: helix-turn-helix domain-containing protein, partial [Phycicoccus sp.]